ncbi:MAG: hypothetical protein ACE5HF_03375 [Gemmatimonadota bacterium]
MDWRQALRDYVEGRHAAGPPEPEAGAREHPAGTGEGTAGAGPLLRRAIAVPDRLDFHRSAGIWRTKIGDVRRSP